MLKVDEFESVFRSAIKETYQHQDVVIKSAFLVTDMVEDKANQLLPQVKEFCQHLPNPENIEWKLIYASGFQSAEELLHLVEGSKIDLVVTYRNLHSDTWRHPFSLGEHLDVLLQKTEIPVLVIPHPRADFARENALQNCHSVMVATDHMVNDHRLVQYGIAFIDQNSQLYLSHIEDEVYFERVIDAIAKIPTIDTDEVKQKLALQLLKEPAEYIDSIKTELNQLAQTIEVIPIVKFGHQLRDYIKYIEQHDINLLVINTKDGDQMAMHGLAYPLAIEVRQIPLLML